MRKYVLALAVIVSVCLYFLPTFIQAQEAAQEPAEETEFSYGTVKSVSGDQLVLSEYDYDQDKDVDVTYTVPPEAELENVTALSEVAVGDIVDIDFLVKDGQKVATLVTVEKPTEEDEDIDLEEEEKI